MTGICFEMLNELTDVSVSCTQAHGNSASRYTCSFFQNNLHL